ncbi:hypothetical protein ACJX0J_038269, partial [Zea mays]
RIEIESYRVYFIKFEQSTYNRLYGVSELASEDDILRFSLKNIIKLLCFSSHVLFFRFLLILKNTNLALFVIYINLPFLWLYDTSMKIEIIIDKENTKW